MPISLATYSFKEKNALHQIKTCLTIIFYIGLYPTKMQSLIILIEFKRLKMHSGLTHWKMNFYHSMENVDPKGIFFFIKRKGLMI